jgi:3-phenylpropionate/trans-cinnamate dioxygenase ferredoxin subunit
MMEERICSVHDVADGESRRFELGSLDIVVVRIGDHWYAIDDRCTHQDVSLAGGPVHAGTREIECPKHGSCFSLETGEPSSLPAIKPANLYDLRIMGDDVMVVL